MIIFFISVVGFLAFAMSISILIELHRYLRAETPTIKNRWAAVIMVAAAVLPLILTLWAFN